MMTCRLLYLVGQLRRGGLERELCNLLQAMDSERYRPEVVLWNVRENNIYVPQIRALGVPVHSFPPEFSGAAKLRAFRHLVRELKPEVVHSYSFYTNFAAYWATVGTQVVALGSIRSDFTFDKQSNGPWLGRLSSRWPRHQICNSGRAADAVQRSRSLFVPKRVYVVRQGVDLERFQRVPFSVARQAHIAGVGSLLPVKRWDRLLAAALDLKQRGLDCLVRIAGDGPLRGSLEQRAQNFGLANRIEFIGDTDDIPSFLANATFLVLPSDHEGCPNVVMEAMACGRAVVATDVGDVRDLVEDGKTGFVVRRGDDMALVARMATLLTEPDLCRKMGESGRLKAEREFGLDRYVAEVIAAYQASGWRET